MVKGAVKLPRRARDPAQQAEEGRGPAPRVRLPCGRVRGETVVPREIFSPEEVGALVYFVQRRLPRTIAAGGRIAGGYNLQERRKRWEKVCWAMCQLSGVQRTYNQVTHRWTDLLDRERDLLDLLGVEVPGLGPPRGKRAQEEDAVREEDEGQAGEGSSAGPSGTSGGGASAEVVVEGDSSGEEAVQAPDDTSAPVRVHTVVAGRVAPSKSYPAGTKRKEQARLARQRRLDATVAEYRRLVALEEEESQCSTTTSSGTAASSSAPPRAASQRSAPAVRSRAGRANRRRRAAKPSAAAPHRSCKARQRRLALRVSHLEAEVNSYKNCLEGLRLEHAILREEYADLAQKMDSILQ